MPPLTGFNFNTLGLGVGIAIARKYNVPPNQTMRVALPAALFGNLALGVILADRLARQQAPDPTVPAVTLATATPTSTPGTTAATPTGAMAGAGVMPIPTGYPIVSLQDAPVIYEPGQVLVATAGGWMQVPEGATPKYQWFRDGEDIDEKDATTPEYTIKKADVGKSLTVEVTYQDPTTQQDVSMTSEPIAIGPAPATAATAEKSGSTSTGKKTEDGTTTPPSS